MDKNKTNLAGEFFVAAELSKRGFIVALTLGNAKEVDILIRTSNDKNIAVQVKALKKLDCFDLAVDKVKNEIIYVFVSLNNIGQIPDFYILKGSDLLESQEHFYGASLKTQRQTVNQGPLHEHKDRWDKFEL